jgi:hypothetical protein
MKPEWKECPRGKEVGQWVAPYVTMNRKGYIVMSRPTHEKTGEPKAYVLYFDGVNNRIVMKPAALATRNAYPAGPSGRHGGKVVRAYRLMQEFGIEIDETLQFDGIEIDEDGMMTLDLRSAKVSTRARKKD